MTSKYDNMKTAWKFKARQREFCRAFLHFVRDARGDATFAGKAHENNILKCHKAPPPIFKYILPALS